MKYQKTLRLFIYKQDLVQKFQMDPKDELKRVSDGVLVSTPNKVHIIHVMMNKFSHKKLSMLTNNFFRFRKWKGKDVQ